jgi:hypothetical protein
MSVISGAERFIKSNPAYSCRPLSRFSQGIHNTYLRSEDYFSGLECFDDFGADSL